MRLEVDMRWDLSVLQRCFNHGGPSMGTCFNNAGALVI